MNRFFEEKHISLSDEAGNSIEFFMRPLKVKEMHVVCRISKFYEDGKSHDYVTPLLLGLIIDTISIPGPKIPLGATEKLIDYFMEDNFTPEEEPGGEGPAAAKKEEIKPLSFYFDLLISQGHNYFEILDYPIPLFNDFLIALCDRLTGNKKPMDPLAAFRRMGIPIENRNNGKKS